MSGVGNAAVSSKLVELKANALYWAPAGMKAEEADKMNACRFVVDQEPTLRNARYGVCHFVVDSFATFGPLAIDQVVIFCRLCDAKLKQHSCVVVVTDVISAASQANLAVLLGAWLCLSQSRTANNAVSILGACAQTRYPCSWSPTPETSNVSLTPADCLSGLEAAKAHGWLDYEQFDVEAYQEYITLYDASWLVPGQIMVGADPMSTIADPDPQTCTALEPTADLSPTKRPNVTPNKCDAMDDVAGTTSITTNLTIEIPETPDIPSAAKEKGNKGNEASKSAIPQPMLSPAKAYGTNKPVMFGRAEMGVLGVMAEDFITFLLQKNVKVCVRANMTDEPGLKEIGGSYDPMKFVSHEVQHVHVPFPDSGACLPPPTLLGKVMHACEMVGAPSASAAAFFHCKSGFGRSAMYACCLLTSKYEIPGNALLGWLRLVRPGAVTCASQERFVRSLRGAAELERYQNKDQCCSIL